MSSFPLVHTVPTDAVYLAAFGVAATDGQIVNYAGTLYIRNVGAWGAIGAGTSPRGVATVHRFPFTHSTAGLLTGATCVFTDAYVPVVGDVILDFWFEIGTAWNGTTPKGDFGTFIAPTVVGLLGILGSGAADMTAADADVEPGGAQGILASNQAAAKANGFVASQINSWIPNGPLPRIPAKFTVIHPLKIVVSQDGSITGADPVSTVGSGAFYLVTATPA